MFLRGQYAREGIELPFRLDLRANFRSGLALRSRISSLVIGPLVSSTILRLIGEADGKRESGSHLIHVSFDFDGLVARVVAHLSSIPCCRHGRQQTCASEVRPEGHAGLQVVRCVCTAWC